MHLCQLSIIWMRVCKTVTLSTPQAQPFQEHSHSRLHSHSKPPLCNNTIQGRSTKQSLPRGTPCLPAQSLSDLPRISFLGASCSLCLFHSKPVALCRALDSNLHISPSPVSSVGCRVLLLSAPHGSVVSGPCLLTWYHATLPPWWLRHKP